MRVCPVAEEVSLMAPVSWEVVVGDWKIGRGRGAAATARGNSLPSASYQPPSISPTKFSLSSSTINNTTQSSSPPQIVDTGIMPIPI